MIKKLFGELNMTWKVVTVFALAAGTVTALMAMLVPDGNSFHEIAVSLEAWVLCALIIITNCKTPREAALKTFVFFLISQPLVYLLQVPFSWMGWQLFQFYRYWFMITLLTLPGAFLGWYVKKDSVISALILSVMLVLLSFLGVGYAQDAWVHFPNHVISTLFCFGQIPLLIFGIFRNKKAILTASAISAAATVIFAVNVLLAPSMDKDAYFQLDEEQFPTDISFAVQRVEDEKISTAEIGRVPDGPWVLRVRIREPGANTIFLTDEAGNEYSVVVTCDAEGQVEMAETREPPVQES